ncbi:DUF5658 family protein [Mesobacillus jeotgali]|uniref:DUF5658 family protein n=1 Tax=Mesobacillus jeotgali TaxID=129985 RepID=UPI0035A3CADC
MVDAFLTHFGLKHSYINELNPIMEGVYNANPLFFLFIKLSFSVVLYLFVLYKKVPRSALIMGLILLASAFYSLALAVHLSWIILVLV